MDLKINTTHMIETSENNLPSEKDIRDVADRLRQIGDDMDQRYAMSNANIVQNFQNFFTEFVIPELHRKFIAISSILNTRWKVAMTMVSVQLNQC